MRRYERQRSNLGCVLVDSLDWERPGVTTLVSNVLKNAKSGSIVLMHDGGGDRSETVQALPHIISGLRTVSSLSQSSSKGRSRSEEAFSCPCSSRYVVDLRVLFAFRREKHRPLGFDETKRSQPATKGPARKTTCPSSTTYREHSLVWQLRKSLILIHTTEFRFLCSRSIALSSESGLMGNLGSSY